MKQLISVTAEQMEEIERLAIYQYGFQIGQLLENAGRSLARLCRIILGGRVEGRSILVLAGGGKNAGGGLAAARNLHNWGADARVGLAMSEGALKRSAMAQLNILRSMNMPIYDPEAVDIARLDRCDLLIDAVLDYGATGDPETDLAITISQANKSKCPVVSLDVPSGLDATTGEAYRPCVAAAATLALALPKTGLLEADAARYVGQLWLADVGLPPETYHQVGLAGDNPFIEDDLVLLRPTSDRTVGKTA